MKNAERSFKVFFHFLAELLHPLPNIPNCLGFKHLLYLSLTRRLLCIDDVDVTGSQLQYYEMNLSSSQVHVKTRLHHRY